MTPEEKADLYAAVQDYYRRRRRLNLKTAGAIGAGMAAEYAGRDPYAIMDRILRPASRPAQLDPTEQAKAVTDMMDLARKHDEAYLKAGKDKLTALKDAQAIKDDLMAKAMELYLGVEGFDAALKESRNTQLQQATSDVQTALRDVVKQTMGDTMPAQMLLGLDLPGTDKIVSKIISETKSDFSAADSTVSKLFSVFAGPLSDTQPQNLKTAIVAQILADARIASGDSVSLENYLDGVSNQLAQAGAKPGVQEQWAAISKKIQNDYVGPNSLFAQANALLTTALTKTEGYQDTLLTQLSGSKNFDPDKFREIYNTLSDPSGEGNLEDTITGALESLGDPQGLPQEEREKYNAALDQLTDEASISNPSLIMVREQIYESPAFKEYMQQTGIVDPLMALKQLKKEMKAKHRGAIAESRRKMRQRDQQLEKDAAEGEDDTLLGATPELSPLNVKSMPFTEEVKARPSVKQRLRGKLFELGSQQRAVPGTPDQLPEDDDASDPRKRNKRKLLSGGFSPV